MDWELLHEEQLAQGLFCSFERQTYRGADGDQTIRDIVRHPGGVSVLPLIDGQVTLIEQYRVAVGRRVIEAPAGKLEAGEDPTEAAVRECIEEVGLRPGPLTAIGPMFSSPGFTDEIIHLFLATSGEWVAAAPHGAEEQDATLVRMSLAEAVAAVRAGSIMDGKTRVLVLTAATTES